MSNIKKFNNTKEEAQEIKKPFKFVNINADVSFDKVTESDNTFLFFNGDGKIPNSMIPTDNPYDVAIDYLNKTASVASEDSQIGNFQSAFTSKYNAAMQQNAWIVFENGLKKFLSVFENGKSAEENITNLFNGLICGSIYDFELFGTVESMNMRPNESPSYMTDINNPHYSKILYDNNIKCSNHFLQSACQFYKNLIAAVVRNSDLCKDITIACAEQDGIDIALIPESSYTAYATAKLNQLATEDLLKLQDIVCIVGSQIIFEYERSIAIYIASKK